MLFGSKSNAILCCQSNGNYSTLRKAWAVTEAGAAGDGRLRSVETPPRQALSSRKRVLQLAHLDEHRDRRAGRLDRLRGPSRPGIGARAAELWRSPEMIQLCSTKRTHRAD